MKRRRQLLLPTQRAGLSAQPPGEQQAAAAASKTEPGYCCPDRQRVASVAQKPGANGIWQPGRIHSSRLTCGPLPSSPRHNAAVRRIQTARLSQTARSEIAVTQSPASLNIFAEQILYFLWLPTVTMFFFPLTKEPPLTQPSLGCSLEGFTPQVQSHSNQADRWQ